MAFVIRIQSKLDDDNTVPRSFEDYQVNVNETGLPSGVTLERKA